MLYSGEIDEFVEKELLPDAAETMNFTIAVCAAALLVAFALYKRHKI